MDEQTNTTLAEAQLLPTTGSASVDKEAERIPADSVHGGNHVAVESTDSGSSPSALTPTPQPDGVKTVAVERQWVRYLSPEGFPYLYNEVTGESEWVVSGEGEPQSPQTEEPTGHTEGGAMHWEPGDTRHEFDKQEGHRDLLRTTSMETGEMGSAAYRAEGESADTCEVPHWSRDSSQDTSGPDAR